MIDYVNYFKTNHLALIVIASILYVSASLNGGVAGVLGAVGDPADLSTFTNPVTFSNTSSPGGVNIASSSATTFRAGATTLTSTLEVTATTTMNGNLVVTQSNTATSSLRVGCVQTVATSTATPINLTFFASSTLNIDGASVTSGFGGNAVQGLVLWSFGNCPRI